MSSDRAFRIPRAHQDRVHPRQLVAIAATCLSVGVALSGVLKTTHREPPEPGYAWQHAAAAPMLHTLPTAQAAQLVLEVASALHSVAGTETSISAATATAPGPKPASPVEREPAKSAQPTKTAKQKLVRGALTYRCDPRRKSEACPHDRVLEARVWRLLTRLTTCPGTADAPGRVDLRLWFEPGTATRAVFAAPTISPGLNLRAVSQCVASDLSKLRATRKADRFELSVGLGLARQN